MLAVHSCGDWVFQPIELTDKQRIERVLKPLGRNDSALGFANLFSLQEKYGTEFCLADGVLHLRQTRRVAGKVAYYPPLGATDFAESMQHLLECIEAEGRAATFVGISADDRDELERAFPGAFSFASDRAFAEYLYDARMIADYAGPGLAKKRREVSKFNRLYGEAVSFEPLSPENLEEAMAFQRTWFEECERVGTDEHPLESEHSKILLDADHFWSLDLEGVLLRVAGNVEGYAYGSVLPGGAFDVMVLKGNLSFRFIWRVLLQELARRVVDRAPLLNLEEDLGLPGLRENKMSYQPLALLEKFTAEWQR